jgi:hypothetical protein
LNQAAIKNGGGGAITTICHVDLVNDLGPFDSSDGSATKASIIRLSATKSSANKNSSSKKLTNKNHPNNTEDNHDMVF